MKNKPSVPTSIYLLFNLSNDWGPWIIIKATILKPKHHCNQVASRNFFFSNINQTVARQRETQQRRCSVYETKCHRRQRYSHFAVHLELSCKTRRSSLHDIHIEHRRGFNRHSKPQHNKQSMTESSEPQRTSIGGPVNDDTPVNVAAGAAVMFPLLPHVRLCPACNTVLLHRSPSPLPSILPHSDQTSPPSSRQTARDTTVSGVKFQNTTSHESW